MHANYQGLKTRLILIIVIEGKVAKPYLTNTKSTQSLLDNRHV